MNLSSRLSALARIGRRFRDHPLTQGRVPSSFAKLARYQLAWRLTGEPTVHEWVGGIRLIVGRGMTGVTPEVYLGVAEFADTLFFAHLLRQGDLFVDVGANAGTYSLVASRIGRADVLAIEPIGHAVERPKDNVRLNDVANLVNILQLGVSEGSGSLHFTADQDAINRVTERSETSVEVEVSPLDLIVGEQTPYAIKIDVEGHERNVIRGAQRVLAQKTLNAICVETGIENRSSEFLDSIRNFGFRIVCYDAKRRELTAQDSAGPHNTLFVRDVVEANSRLQSAPKVAVSGEEY